MLYYDRVDLSKGIDVVKVITVKIVSSATIGFLIMGLNFQVLFVMVVMI